MRSTIAATLAGGTLAPPGGAMEIPSTTSERPAARPREVHKSS